MNEARPKRRWVQFSLRAFMASIAVLGALFASTVHTLEKARRESEALRSLQFSVKRLAPGNWAACSPFDHPANDNSFVCHVRFGKPPAPARLVNWAFGQEFPYITTALAHGHRFDDSHLQTVAGFNNVKRVMFTNTAVTEDGAEWLRQQLPQAEVYLVRDL